MQSVRGVERISPIGPQIQLQKIATTITAVGDRPVLWPYSSGSSTWPVIASLTRNSPAVHSAIDQPGSTAAASAVGRTAAISEPI